MIIKILFRQYSLGPSKTGQLLRAFLLTTIMLTLSEASFAEIDPDGAPFSGSYQITAGGFLSDPITMEILAGGVNSTNAINTPTGICDAGFIWSVPDVNITYTAGGNPLRFYVDGLNEDTSLAIRTPNGSWYCVDDFDGLNPVIDFSAPLSGVYNIFIGSFEAYHYLNVSLGITERPYKYGGTPPASDVNNVISLVPVMSLLMSPKVGSIFGIVQDTQGNLLPGVEVKISDTLVATSDDAGAFTLKNLPAAEKLVLNFYGSDLVMTTDILRVVAGVDTPVEAVMMPVGTRQEFVSSAGATISHAGGTITIPPDALIDSEGVGYSGPATAAFTVFDPTNEAQREAFPGRFAGIRLDGTWTMMESFGFLDISITDSSGRNLQLANDRNAQIKIPIPAAIQGDAADTIPLWTFNESSGQWEEVGTGSKNGAFYEGSIPHFSLWNYDKPFQNGWIAGAVTCRGTPVDPAKVSFAGLSWISSDMTNGGKFRIPVPAERDIAYTISYKTNQASGETIAPGNDETQDMGTMEMCGSCGDGQIDIDFGEQCDDQNTVSGDGCSADCQEEYCGDGIQNNIVEECDDQNTVSGDGCSADCRAEYCGDGVQNNVVEECDDQNTVSGDGCSAGCRVEYCGDGIQNNIVEECDDQNTVSGDGCSADCQDEYCGDGIQNNVVEECDDQNTVSGDGCSADCRAEYCGDGVRNNIVEECDDRNTVSGDGCAADCRVEYCGDGIRNNITEECDDGANVDGDGCSSTCAIETDLIPDSECTFAYYQFTDEVRVERNCQLATPIQDSYFFTTVNETNKQFGADSYIYQHVTAQLTEGSIEGRISILYQNYFHVPYQYSAVVKDNLVVVDIVDRDNNNLYCGNAFSAACAGGEEEFGIFKNNEAFDTSCQDLTDPENTIQLFEECLQKLEAYIPAGLESPGLCQEWFVPSSVCR